MNTTEIDKYLWTNLMPNFLEKIGLNRIAKAKKNIITGQYKGRTKSGNQPILFSD